MPRVRPATREELSAILSVEQMTPGAPHWSESIWRQMLDSSGSAAEVQRHVLVAEHETAAHMVIIGFGVITLLFLGSDSEAEVESLAISKEWQRQGLGQLLLADLVHWAAERGATVVRLEVRASNAAAIHLYTRAGFRQMAVRRGYYTDPAEDALVFERPVLPTSEPR